MDEDPAVMLTGRATADPARDGPLGPDLVTRARTGDKQAWDALVEQYAPMIWSICCSKYRLGHADAQDVGQSVWLRLVEQLDKIRDPAALPGWLAVTTRRECGRVLGTARRLRAPVYAPDIENLPDGQADPADRELLTAERHAALREAFSRLPPDGQHLIAMLIMDPPVPYAEISARLGIPVGSIGPKRIRCLDKLRRDPAISALINAARFGAGVFDVLLSNFGVMFFEDPAAAFANLRKALRRGGRLAFVCWRTREENLFFTIGFAETAAVLGLREMPGPGAAFSLADTGRVGALLSGAGFGGIEFAQADEPMLIGRDVDDVLEYERASPTAAEVLAGLSPAQAAELTGQVRDRLAPYASPEGVVMPGAAWLVSAQAV